MDGQTKTMMLIRNPALNVDGTIDVDLEHPDHGWIPCTLTPDDEFTAPYHAVALTMNPTPYVAPAPAPITPEQVKAEANERILAFAPMHRQNNMLARAILLQDMGRENWDESHQAEADACYALWEAIDSIREASQTLCALDVIPQDYQADEHWPAQSWPESA